MRGGKVAQAAQEGYCAQCGAILGDRPNRAPLVGERRYEDTEGRPPELGPGETTSGDDL